MEKPFLTIGIASYNYKKYLGRAFKAIKNQSFKDYEILYCDDGSTDGSVDYIKKLIKVYPEIRIRLVAGENQGVMANKNRILENAKGKYVMLCDADDWMEPECLAKLCGKAIEAHADQVVAAFQNVDENGRILQIQEIPNNPSKWAWGVHHATIYNMQIIRENKLRFKLDAYPDDVYFNTIFHHYSGKTEFLPDVLYNWFTHSGSASSRQGKKDNWHGYLMLKSVNKYMLPIATQEDKLSREEIEYMMLKMYALSIYFRSPDKRYNDFYAEYRKCRKLMRKCWPEYGNNKIAKKLDGKGYVRLRTAQIIYFTLLLEKMHLMSLALFGYWLVSHFITFGI